MMRGMRNAGDFSIYSVILEWELAEKSGMVLWCWEWMNQDWPNGVLGWGSSVRGWGTWLQELPDYRNYLRDYVQKMEIEKLCLPKFKVSILKESPSLRLLPDYKNVDDPLLELVPYLQMRKTKYKAEAELQNWTEHSRFL